MHALTAMKPTATPGSDGFTVQLYNVFRDLLKPEFCAVIRRLAVNGVLSNSFRQGRIILLSKCCAASPDPSYWRPITLLNVDYKLVVSILNRRLREVLPMLLHPLQVCSAPDHRNSSLTCLILEYAVNSQSQSLDPPRPTESLRSRRARLSF